MSELVLFAWVPVVLGLFALFPPRRAVLFAYIGGWLFLPVNSLPVAGFPDYSKLSATALASLLGVLIFDPGRVRALRLRLLDLPMLVWCVVPLASSLANDLGSYDGLATVFSRSLKWGIPYLLGRLYFADREALRELALGIFLGGLAYVPLCLIELRFSPQLHNWIYGFHPHEFGQTLRFGGYRPTVFLAHGLAVAAWMSSASLLGICLWGSGELWGVPTRWGVVAVVVTSLLCKSMNGWVELGGGLAVLVWAGRLRSSLPLWLLLLVAPAYLVARTQGLLPTEAVIGASGSYLAEDRAASLAFRLENEDRLMEKALARPALGWGGWGRSRVLDDEDTDVTTTDGLWIIALGENGVVGLASLTLALLLPLLSFVVRQRPRPWDPSLAMAVMLCLYLIDSLFNDMFNPVFIVGAGALLGRSVDQAAASAPRTCAQFPANCCSS